MTVPTSDARDYLENWLKERRITEVECQVPDLAGISRGKILPANKFITTLRDRGLRIPESIFIQTVTGGFPDNSDVNPADSDVYLTPDVATLRVVPWHREPTAQIINDCTYADGSVVDISPRQVLKRVVDLYRAKGLSAVVAPELEFYLVAKNVDPDLPLEPPVGRSGRPETGRQAFGIDATNEFDPLFEDVYDYCEVQELDIDTLTHEGGPAQMEINFNHGDPLSLADQAFMFKRTVRECALRHNVFATFMAKPLQSEPGSSMHIHTSVIETADGRNIFARDDGENSEELLWFIGGLQKYLPRVMPLLAPYVNSYRRYVAYSSAPQNVHWGVDNRTTGLRMPLSTPQARRIENRVAGADANPYLAMAATLACGWLGLEEKVEPAAAVEGNAYGMSRALPRHLEDALGRLERCKELQDVLGERFVDVLVDVKEAEYDAYQNVISPWERENLLLNV
ncbi:MAG: glutamine synthetase family protein [Alphaproteobacteria bacterium]|nr:glutamine synthetase family protein [Alphaproteobacteria bacterium]